MGETSDKLTMESIVKMGKAVSEIQPDGHKVSVYIKTNSLDRLHEIDEELHNSVKLDGKEGEFEYADVVNVTVCGVDFVITP